MPSNFAAVLPAVGASFVVREVALYNPGPDELLVKNEVIAFNPVEGKIAKLGLPSPHFPAIIGSTFGGTIEAVGEKVKDWKVGDRVVVSKGFPGAKGNQYGAYQRYVVVADRMVGKVPEAIDPAVPASLLMNLTCVSGMFAGRLGMERPKLDDTAPSGSKDTKVLIYGGSSSFGSLAVQYLSQAGYHVVTTSSPRNDEFVSKLGATVVIDHTLKHNVIVEKLVAAGPYKVVVDMISARTTIAVTAGVLEAQNGGKLYAMEPAQSGEVLPAGVERVFEPWSASLYEDKNTELLEWTLTTYLSQGLLRGTIIPLPIEKVPGGLKGVDEALERLQKGVSGLRLVADPWE